MLSAKLDPDLEMVLDRGVDDLARYNILRYLHDHPDAQGGVLYFADELGLRSPDRVGEALDALAGCGLLEKAANAGPIGNVYRLSSNSSSRDLVDRLYHLSSCSFYGELVERLAARSLHRARRPLMASRNGHKK